MNTVHYACMIKVFLCQFINLTVFSVSVPLPLPHFSNILVNINDIKQSLNHVNRLCKYIPIEAKLNQVPVLCN